MMNMGHVFTARARLKQFEQDCALNLSHCGLDSVRNLYPLIPGSTQCDALGLAQLIHESRHDIRAGNNYFMRWAASHNDLPLARTLHSLGADADACAGYAARYFSYNGNLAAVRWLHELGYAARHRDDALTYAADSGHVPIMDFLESIGPMGRPPARALFAATRHAHIPAMNWLVARGTDPRVDNDFIIFHAMSSADIPTLEWVKAKGVDFRTANPFAQIQAAYSGSVAAFDWFEENGVEINPDRVTHVAATCGHADLLQWAVDRGGTVSQYTEKMALKRCAQNDNPPLISLIMKQRASRTSALVTDAVSEVLSPPPLTTRLWRLLKS